MWGHLVVLDNCYIRFIDTLKATLTNSPVLSHVSAIKTSKREFHGNVSVRDSVRDSVREFLLLSLAVPVGRGAAAALHSKVMLPKKNYNSV